MAVRKAPFGKALCRARVSFKKSGGARSNQDMAAFAHVKDRGEEGARETAAKLGSPAAAALAEA